MVFFGQPPIYSILFLLKSQVTTKAERYEVPVKLFEGVNIQETIDKDNDIYSWGCKNDPFGIIVKRKKTNSIL